MKNAPRLAFIFSLLLAATAAQAERRPEPGTFDPRIRTVTYNPNDVVVIQGFYGYAQMIEFARAESVQNIAIGDSLAWQVSPNDAGNRLFLKPVEPDARTNLAVVTNKRSYNFELVAAAEGARSTTYAVRFRYPEDVQAELNREVAAVQKQKEQEVAPERGDIPPEQWNLDYSYQGDPKMAPIHVFDDTKFTYFQFRERQEVPAIFLVGPDQNESLVNFHVDGKYVVVQRTGRQFTLRYGGGSVICVYNDRLAFAEK